MTETTTEVLDEIEQSAEEIRKPKKQKELPVSRIVQNPLSLVQDAISQNWDEQRLSRILDLVDRLNAQKSLREYTESMNLAQGEMPTVIALKMNTQTKSTYAPLEDVMIAIKPIYTKHGFTLEFTEAESKIPEHRRVVCKVRHIGGHVEEFYLDSKIDNKGPKGGDVKTEIQGLGSMMSYCRKYLGTMIFNIVVAHEDNDGNDPSKTWDEAQCAFVRSLFEQCENHGKPIPERKFIEWASNEALLRPPAMVLEDLPVSVYDRCVSQLKKKLDQP